MKPFERKYDEPAKVLWDTWAQVSMVAEDFLKSQLPAVHIKDIQQLLGTDGSINLQAGNGTDIPYCGWAEIGVKSVDDETQIRVSFLVTKENIEQPITGLINLIRIIKVTKVETSHHTKFNITTCVLNKVCHPLNQRFVSNTCEDTFFFTAMMLQDNTLFNYQLTHRYAKRQEVSLPKK